MADLIYTANVSLDGYVADAAGNFDFTAPSEEVHAYINDLERAAGTYLYGRRLYETMVVWEDMRLDEAPAVTRDYAGLWRAAEKVVFSSTLTSVTSQRTQLVRTFDVDWVRQLKASTPSPVSIGGATLAKEAIRAGLVDEIRLFVSPVIVGGGTASLPSDIGITLELIDERRFDSGVVHLRYRTVV
jgi:dihydrofolate reductase